MVSRRCVTSANRKPDRPDRLVPRGQRARPAPKVSRVRRELPGEAAFNVTIENCGFTQTFTAPPERAVSLTQHTTEIMLALGLQDKMVGTAYLDDAILPQYDAAYKKIPVLSDKYPSHEVLLGVSPDFVISGFASAFARPGECRAARGPAETRYPLLSQHRSVPERAGPLTMDDITLTS